MPTFGEACLAAGLRPEAVNSWIVQRNINPPFAMGRRPAFGERTHDLPPAAAVYIAIINFLTLLTLEVRHADRLARTCVGHLTADGFPHGDRRLLVAGWDDDGIGHIDMMTLPAFAAQRPKWTIIVAIDVQRVAEHVTMQLLDVEGRQTWLRWPSRPPLTVEHKALQEFYEELHAQRRYCRDHFQLPPMRRPILAGELMMRTMRHLNGEE